MTVFQADLSVNAIYIRTRTKQKMIPNGLLTKKF
jgi:hypothetical protein